MSIQIFSAINKEFLIIFNRMGVGISGAIEDDVSFQKLKMSSDLSAMFYLFFGPFKPQTAIFSIQKLSGTELWLCFYYLSLGNNAKLNLK